MFRNLFLFLFLILLQTSLSHAQSLGEYLNYAVQETELESSVDLRINELSRQKEAAGLLENPSVGLEYGRVKNTGITGSLVGATVEQSLPINGRLGLNKDKVSEEIKQAKISGGWKVNQFRGEVLENFLFLWLEREKISHAKHRIQDLQILRKYLSTRKFTSPQQKSDAYLIKKKIEEIEYQLNQDSYQEKRLKKVLESLTQREIKEFQIPLKSTSVLDSYLNEILGSNSKIEEFRRSIKNKDLLSLKQQERKWIPDLNVGYAYQKENVPGGNLSHAIGLSFSIPIFNSGKKQADQVRAQMRVREAQWLIQDAKRKSQVGALLERFRYYSRIASGSLKESEKEHGKELRKIKNYFLKGLINAQTYLDAEEISHDLHYRQVNATQEVVKVFIDASALVGKDFELNEVLL